MSLWLTEGWSGSSNSSRDRRDRSYHPIRLSAWRSPTCQWMVSTLRSVPQLVWHPYDKGFVLGFPVCTLNRLPLRDTSEQLGFRRTRLSLWQFLLAILGWRGYPKKRAPVDVFAITATHWHTGHRDSRLDFVWSLFDSTISPSIMSSAKVLYRYAIPYRRATRVSNLKAPQLLATTKARVLLFL